MNRFVYPDPVKAAEACARHIATRLEETLSGQAFATLAISGGSSPKAMFPALAGAAVDWQRVHLFWVDERAVPPDHPDSNFGLAEPLLIQPAGVPLRNVHRIRGELQPDEAAYLYTKEIRTVFNLGPGEIPHFDVIHCGTGSDGHTASLFPGEPLIEDREGIAAAVYAEARNQWRVTLLPAPLLAARHTVFFATGAEKAQTISAIFDHPYDPMLLPAQLLTHHGRVVAWFLDHGAASNLD